MARYDLSGSDGVLAYGAVLRRLYEARCHKAWTWHEVADVGTFRPLPGKAVEGDLVWIGNWGDNERAAELQEFLIEPCKQLKLKAAVYGARYPEAAIRALRDAGVEYKGWLPNFHAPEVFARFPLLQDKERAHALSQSGLAAIRARHTCAHRVKELMGICNQDARVLEQTTLA
jgi:spore maturation protein CgeB